MTNLITIKEKDGTKHSVITSAWNDIDYVVRSISRYKYVMLVRCSTIISTDSIASVVIKKFKDKNIVSTDEIIFTN